ncbi:hypothetical protein KM1_096540 [Entamoeba histolytica HM-3:IMSS]|uniref:Uncharacterized protein n=1 Tax=Entamoeba histolytica HM-3:IMSS TaxID=885315 RepID=M7X701_ENTHI|nr:hypothetical protein KM1_096540 [Entamoeba histolytica HM-3:IMSS]
MISLLLIFSLCTFAYLEISDETNFELFLMDMEDEGPYNYNKAKSEIQKLSKTASQFIKSARKMASKNSSSARKMINDAHKHKGSQGIKG